MATRECPVCCVRLVRNESDLAACLDCQRYFHSACLSASGPSRRCNRCSLKGVKGTATTATIANNLCSSQPDATPVQPSSTATSEPASAATPTASQQSSKRRASTPSPCVTPVLKAYCSASVTAASPILAAVMDESAGAGPDAPAPFCELDADGAMKAALHYAPPYIHMLYNLMKSSHDANAAANASNAASLAGVSHVLAENSRVLSSLVPRVEAVEQRLQTFDANQLALSARHDADIAAVRAGVSYNSAVIQESLSHRSLKDPRELIVRGITPAVQLEPMPLAAALLTALKLQHLVKFVTNWRAWSPPARADDRGSPATDPQTAPALATPLRAVVFTLVCPAARDDILRRTPGLKDLDCQSIFGAGGPAKLSVNALWPDPVHKLLKRATARHKQLGHLWPIVKNLTVFMPPTKNGPLIPVTCEADVDALPPPSS